MVVGCVWPTERARRNARLLEAGGIGRVRPQRRACTRRARPFWTGSGVVRVLVCVVPTGCHVSQCLFSSRNRRPRPRTHPVAGNPLHCTAWLELLLLARDRDRGRFSRPSSYRFSVVSRATSSLDRERWCLVMEETPQRQKLWSRSVEAISHPVRGG